MTRRIVLALIPIALAAQTTEAAKGLTARQVIERIQKNVGVPWRQQTIDTFKAGNPDVQVTGIATTFAATLDVLKRAAASGKNLIITHEPTFYNHTDSIAAFENDPVVRAKRAFIEEHGLVIWRFHDHWHMRRPDGIVEGVVAKLGWQDYRDTNSPLTFTLPEVTLGGLAASLRDRLKIRTMRVIGDPGMKLTKVGFSPGASGSNSHIRAFERGVDVLLIGESPEWETVEYARDAAAAGQHKGLIILGHAISEEPGMDECARWLRTFVTEVPVEFIPAGEPFWRP